MFSRFQTKQSMCIQSVYSYPFHLRIKGEHENIALKTQKYINEFIKKKTAKNFLQKRG